MRVLKNCYAEIEHIDSGYGYGDPAFSDRDRYGFMEPILYINDWDFSGCYFISELLDYELDEEQLSDPEYMAQFYSKCARKLTDIQSKISSYYVGYDFLTIWGIDSSKNDGIPYLRCFDEKGGIDPPMIKRVDDLIYIDWSGLNG